MNIGMLKIRSGWQRSSSVFALAMALGILLLSAGCTGAKAKDAPTPTPLPTSALSANPTYPVQVGEVVKELKFTGRVIPVVEQRLFFRSGGYVRNIYVQWGDEVKAGQVLADLEIGDLENQVAQAEINLRGSERELVSAQQVISDTLAEAQISLKIEQLRLEEARYYLKNDDRLPQRIAVQIQEESVKLAELRVEQLKRGPDARLIQAVDLARLTLERLKAQVTDSSILAPFDGKVRTVNIQKGDNVTAFSQTAITVYDPAKLEISIAMTSVELEEMDEGMAVKIKLANRPGEEWEGLVRLLPYPYGTGDPNAGSGQPGGQDTSARISFLADAQETGYELGDIVDVQVILERKTGVLWLPPQVIRNFEGRKFVVVQEGDRQRRVNLVLGIESEERVEIVEGLQEGQIVVSP